MSWDAPVSWDDPNPGFGDLVDWEDDSDTYNEVEALSEPIDRYLPDSHYVYYPVHLGQIFENRF